MTPNQSQSRATIGIDEDRYVARHVVQRPAPAATVVRLCDRSIGWSTPEVCMLRVEPLYPGGESHTSLSGDVGDLLGDSPCPDKGPQD